MKLSIKSFKSFFDHLEMYNYGTNCINVYKYILECIYVYTLTWWKHIYTVQKFKDGLLNETYLYAIFFFFLEHTP